jgi:hypothetical protein
MAAWNDEDWLEGVRHWVHGGLAPAGDGTTERPSDGPPERAAAAAMLHEPPAPADAYSALIEAACERAACERQQSAARQ